MYDAADTQDTSSMTYSCPHCQGRFDFDTAVAQAEVFCPRCGKGFDPVKLSTMQYDAGRPASETVLTANVEPVLGSRLGQYRLDAILGRGGMGAVYRALQTSLDRPVALKVLPLQMGQDPDFVARFDREARALAELSHPNIVAIYDKGTSDGRYYFAMELVEGVSLREVIRSKKMKPAEALALVPQLCEALEYAHAKGVIHRDIKPENILVDRAGKVKIADFGLARIVRGEGASSARPLTGTNVVMGTFDYMAPEQRESAKDVDHRADIYSLGVVIYELLTGELPIGRFAPPSKKVQVDVRIDEVVMQLLEKEPSARFQRASDVSTRLEAIRTGPPAAAPSPRRIARTLAGGIACVVVGFFFLWLSTRYTERVRLAATFLSIVGTFGVAISAAMIGAASGMMSSTRHPIVPIAVGIGLLETFGFLADAVLSQGALGAGWMSIVRGAYFFGGIPLLSGVMNATGRIVQGKPSGERVGKWINGVCMVVFLGGAFVLQELNGPSPERILEFMTTYSFVSLLPLYVADLLTNPRYRKPLFRSTFKD